MIIRYFEQTGANKWCGIPILSARVQQQTGLNQTTRPLECPHNHRAAGVGEVHIDLEAGAVVEKTVEHKRRFVRGRRDDRGMIWPVLVGHMGVE